MTARLEMLQVARLAPRVLGERATARLLDFVRSRIDAQGRGLDRAGAPDLFYTGFALDCLIALHQRPASGPARAWLEALGDGDGLDLVHLASFARCHAALGGAHLSPERARALARRLETFRTEAGGYAAEPAATPAGTAYAAFLALGAHQDLGSVPPHAERLARAVHALRSRDGSWSNRPGAPCGVTTATAAAVVVLRQLDRPAPSSLADWIRARVHPEGGFAAAPGVPLPDLLSTATALHALACLRQPIDDLREPTLDFLDSLWTGRAFCATWADDETDVEYAFYALLALGHLAA